MDAAGGPTSQWASPAALNSLVALVLISQWEEDPRYSVTAFRRDILLSCTGQAPLDAEKAPSPSESSVQPPILEHRTCPWIRLLCVRSGKPTPVEDCCDCEFRKTKKCETKPNLLEE